MTDDLLAIASDTEIASHYRIAVMPWPVETNPWTTPATEKSTR